MDPRWQPHLPHPPAAPPSPETRALFAAGWRAAGQECRVQDSGQLLSPGTWRELRELPACVPVRIRMQR